jgi:hypothetical protein
MKLRHAAALALVGWYLMVPPLHKSGVWTRFWYGQFADWNTVNSFDSAKECEDYRRQMIAAAQNSSKHAVSEYPPADAQALPDGKVYSPSAKKLYDPYPTAVCIASDDPRLLK